jgi:metallo-beta-lactamase class B
VKRVWLLGAALAAACGTAAAAFVPPANWLLPQRPYRVAGDLHYVGSAGLSAFLITTPEGHILIDGGLPANAGQIVQNIRRLGYKPSDVKVLLNTHAHFDHSGGLAELKRVTGAKLAAMEGDRIALETGKYPGSEDVAVFDFTPVKVDRVLRDGDTVALGGTVLTARLTPGHSAGCTSWEIPVVDAGAKRTALLHCSSSVAANRLAPREQYPGIVADYERTFQRLKALKADIFLAPHAEQFGMAGKLARVRQGATNPFVDPGELSRFAARSEADFRAELAKQKGVGR